MREEEQQSQYDDMTENHSDLEYEKTANHGDSSERGGTLNHSDSDDGLGRRRNPTGHGIDGRVKPGTLILGRYEVLSELGRGGMGVVFRCFDKVSGTEVAVKSLPPEVSHDEDEMEDVKDNYALVSKLIHQNIAAYKTLEEDLETGDYYVVMEYVQGEVLRRWMRRKRREGGLTSDEVLPILHQVADALDFAHKKKVIHRDVKPANVMVETDGTVKVLDFGLAAQIRSSYSHLSMAETGKSGTRQYMSPEQWRGLPQGAAADQYALAAMAYEMLGGRVPFDNDDTAAMREIVLKEPPLPLEDMSRSANEALARGLAKEAKQRFANCVEFVSALEQGAKRKDNLTLKLAGGVELKMIWIPAGTFMMGSPESEEGRLDHETLHKVTLTKDFWLGETEVTQSQYKAVMGDNPSDFNKGGNYPVERVSWDDAMAFCRKLTERERRAGRLQEGFEYSLPTEAQWEYAARGGNKSKEYIYSGSDNLDEVGWYENNSNQSTHLVGQKNPNELGLYDMSGNVWEWCRDSCEWENGVVTDTYKDGVSEPLCRSGSRRVLRGGSWGSGARYCRSANRNYGVPSDSYNNVGFRLALAPVQ